MQQQNSAADDGVESPLSVEHTIKRLDFENISVSSTQTISAMRAQAQQIRRDIERCREEMADPTELMESLKVAAADYAGIDTSKLLEKYLSLKEEFLQVEAENLFLESYLTPDAESISDSESELHTLEKQFSDLQSMTIRETEQIKSLIGAFTEEMENFPKLMESALNHFAECDGKVHVESTGFSECLDESSPSVGSDTEQKALELSILTGSVQNEILELDMQISKEEEYYKRIQSLHDTYIKLNLLSKILSFFSDWTVIECEDNMVVLAFKGLAVKHKKVTENSSATKHKRVTGNKHVKPLKEVVYKLHIKVHPKTLAVESAQLEPKSEVLIDDILKEMTLCRMMQSLEVSGESHNDLEFLLRRIGQRITASRKTTL